MYGVGIYRIQRRISQKCGELPGVLTQIYIVVRGVEKLLFERDQQRRIQPRGPQETFPGTSCLYRIDRPVEQRQ